MIGPGVNGYNAEDMSITVDPGRLRKHGVTLDEVVRKVQERLGAVRRVVCASPAYLRAKGVPHQLEDVPSHQSVRFTGLTPLDEWDFGPVPHRVAIRSALICNLPEVAIEACVRGLGLGMFLFWDTSAAGQAKKSKAKQAAKAFEERGKRGKSSGRDLIWYLWCGPYSPPFDKEKMATFDADTFDSA